MTSCAGRKFAIVLVAAALLGACSSGSAKSSTSASSTSASSSSPAPHLSTSLRIAFVSDMGPPDPDIFYGTEGNMVTNSVYEGLLQYADNSTTIVGALASMP